MSVGSRLTLIMKNPPLVIPTSWRSRWLVLPSWNRLHRISQITWDIECPHPYDTSQCDLTECLETGICVERTGYRHGHGVSVCGARGYFTMPGIFSRMGRPRCGHCCNILVIPKGDGAPFNEGKDAPWHNA